ncbi:MAG: hypothetical protein ACJ76F_13510 [Bacteroidia bacterium]
MPKRRATVALVAPAQKVKKRAAKAVKKDRAASYNKFKEFEGKQYTGMAVGRSHKWNYDSGVWKETKVTPDEWKISYAVTKRRAGKAPEGSGVPVGTEYHWYILAAQNVKKLDANTYSTEMSGFKFKLAHKRADKEKWSISELTQKKHLVKILEEMASRIKKEIETQAKKTVKRVREKELA